MISVRIVFPGQHVRIRHARQRHVRERFTAAVARRRHAHQARVELVLQIAAQHAVLDERRTLRGSAFIVDVEGAAPRTERAVVDDGALIGRHLLADAARERRRSLAVEIALEAMPDRLMQQDARPTRTEHDRHRARRRRRSVEVHERAAHRLMHQLFPTLVFDEPRETVATAAAAIALLPTAVVFDDHRHIQTNERTHIGGHRPVARHHQHDLVRTRQARHHLLHSRIAPRFDIDLLQQAHLVRIAQSLDRIMRQVQLMTARGAPCLQRRIRPAARNRARGQRRFGQRGQHDLVRIRETGFLSRRAPARRRPARCCGRLLSRCCPRATTILRGSTENTDRRSPRYSP